MSGAAVIRLEEISKRYLLGQRGAGTGLRHVMQEWVTAPLRLLKARSAPKPTVRDFWALRDISFDVKQGEVVGIIGRNGAGKSTLLKILSRITEPTTGRIGIKGRVASLLEVGTGFHPELTGRENIFLNGAILGMTRAEMRSKLDEIIAFAGVEEFLDTPVKRYSSGMYVRLAFAVAAHLDPEILIVDEVLAVGDAEFQQKCLGKMKEVTQGGRTVLFVSHNMAALSALCDRGVYLQKGQVVLVDETAKVLDRYAADLALGCEVPQHSDPDLRDGSGTHRIISIVPAEKEFPAREPMTFRVTIKRRRDDGKFHFSMQVRDEMGVVPFVLSSEYLPGYSFESGDHTFDVTVRGPWLPPGNYNFDAFLIAGGVIDHWPDACPFRVGPDVAKHGYSHHIAPQTGATLPDFQIETVS